MMDEPTAVKKPQPIPPKPDQYIVHVGSINPNVRAELNLTAKGKVQPSVRVYADNLEDAQRQCQELFDNLCEEYKEKLAGTKE